MSTAPTFLTHQIVTQSAALHPDWDVEAHLDHLFDRGVTGVTEHEMAALLDPISGVTSSYIRTLASGTQVVVDGDSGKVIGVYDDREYEPDDELGTCRICDGLGHGYPGAGPCPLEERGEDGCPGWAM